MDWNLFFAATGTLLGCGVAIAGLIKLLVAREVSSKLNGIPHRLQTAEHEIEALRTFKHDMANRWTEVEIIKREVFPEIPPREPYRRRDPHK